jgi:biopolymer transport protein ExbB
MMPSSPMQHPHLNMTRRDRPGRHTPAGDVPATDARPKDSPHLGMFPTVRCQRALAAAGAQALLVIAFTAGALLLPGGARAQAPATAPAAVTPPAAAPAAVPVLTPSTALTPAPAGAPAVKPPVNTYADNPYGLRALWEQGDLVARLTLIVLVVMSVGSWYVLISKLLEQSRLARQARDAQKAFWAADTVRQGADTLDKQSVFRFIAEAALEATRKHDGLIGQVDLNTWVTQSIERAVATVQSRTQEGLAVLATVGSTAPFVGLFGTVWGIYNALVKIGASGQASIDRVAGPVGEALIMTAIGLAVAVPAVMGYNWLVRRNKVGMDTVRAFGSDLHTVLLAASARRGDPSRPLAAGAAPVAAAAATQAGAASAAQAAPASSAAPLQASAAQATPSAAAVSPPAPPAA